jgi:uncharacterized protein YndB with AHSA1/START domain
MAQQGFLVISDITGYSKYVHESELEHARDSLTDLLNILIDHTQSPLVISDVEGDAVFSYALLGGFLQGRTLVDMIESTYAAFRKALELMVINTTCTCNACRNLPNLDLKFFVHYGSFMTQNLGKYIELVGNDVNLVHRLAKNHIKEETGFKAYAAFTQAVIDALELDEFGKSITPYRETFADVGEVQLYVHDLHGVWERLKNSVRIEVTPADALLKFEHEYPVPPSLLWEYITKPEYRAIISGSDNQEFRNLSYGRAGIDSVYYCAHGKRVSPQRIVDWQPFEQYTWNGTIPGVTTILTFRLEPTKDGTRLIHLVGKARGNWFLSTMINILVKFILSQMYEQMYDKNAQRLLQRIQQDLADGTAIISPSVEIDKDQMVSLATQTLTSDAQ